MELLTKCAFLEKDFGMGNEKKEKKTLNQVFNMNLPLLESILCMGQPETEVHLSQLVEQLNDQCEKTALLHRGSFVGESRMLVQINESVFPKISAKPFLMDKQNNSRAE